MHMPDLEVNDWLRKRMGDVGRRIRETALGRRNLAVHRVAAIANLVSAYVADRTQKTPDQIDQMTDADFQAAAKPLLDFLDARLF
jgi:hypothetical protein